MDESQSNTFISNTRLSLAKNQAKANKHPNAELFEIVRFVHPRDHPKITCFILKKRNKQFRLFYRDYMINNNENGNESEQ